jgi:hypothetical protein
MRHRDVDHEFNNLFCEIGLGIPTQVPGGCTALCRTSSLTSAAGD